MKSEVLSLFPWMHLTSIAFFIFISLFVFFVGWTLRKGSKQHYRKISNIPFSDDGENNE